MLINNDNAFFKWLQEEYDLDEIKSINEIGCVNGVRGLHYYSQTENLFNAYGDEILEIIADYSDGLGQCPIKISDFREANRLTNQIVWLGVELVASQITNFIEEKSQEIKSILQEFLDNFDKDTLSLIVTDIMADLD